MIYTLKTTEMGCMLKKWSSQKVSWMLKDSVYHMMHNLLKSIGICLAHFLVLNNL